MKNTSFHEALVQILTEDARYHADAYFFIREAIHFASKTIKKNVRGQQRHFTAAELLEAIRLYALREYGPMAKTILNFWGIHHCPDFGQIVFNLVNKNILKKTENDSIHDFDHGYDFDVAFRAPYLPSCKKQCYCKPGQSQPSASAKPGHLPDNPCQAE